MKISIITFTLGTRTKYLNECIKSIYDDWSSLDIELEQHIVFQGAQAKLTSMEHDQYKIIVHEWPKNIGIGNGLNEIIPKCTGDLLFKMDDDCKIVSSGFFIQAKWIHEQYPMAIFSPQPLGLVNNPMGPPGFKRSVIYNESADQYYMLRHVNHVGGFARFWPKCYDFKFTGDLISGISGNEDGQLSTWACQNKIDMFYVETGMAVEHQEGLGQQIRYGEYFQDRSGDKETLNRWVIK